jgi:hypothetical protein
MTPAAIISAAQAEGVTLRLSPAGTIKATGDGVAVNRWHAVIRERKFEIIEVLRVGPVDTAFMTAEEESTVRAWLVLIEETDQATITEVISQCQRDANARAYFIGRAAVELPEPAPIRDARRISP